MESGVKTKRLYIHGMTCVNCQNKIEKKLRNTAGVKSVKVSYRAGTADISYDTDIISIKSIIAILEKLAYKAREIRPEQGPGFRRIIGTLVIIVSAYILLQQFGILNRLVPGQLADTGMGYGMLFLLGLITSVHCVAMCGGINLSQCIPKGGEAIEKHSRRSVLAPALLYNLGRVVSYTAIGFLLGFAGLLFGGGSQLGLPVMLQGLLKLAVGIFMVIMGINMLGIFPWLRKLNPGLPKFLVRKAEAGKAGSKSPFIVGLLNGLMPCGPLQSMQIIALASGNPLVGALSMLLFSLGTVPLMLGLGSIVSAFGRKFTQTVTQVGAVLVVVLGLAMLSQGGSLSGFLPENLMLPIILTGCAVAVIFSIPFQKPLYRTLTMTAALAFSVLVFSTGGWLGTVSGAETGNPAAQTDIQITDGKQLVTSTLSSGRYPSITVAAGTPVKWIINAPQGTINGCNNRMVIRNYGIEYTFKTGENVVEFTPEEAGAVQYSCWMGMVRGTITVRAQEGGDPSGSEASSAGDSGESLPQYDLSSGPIPAGIVIPAEEVAVAQEKTNQYGQRFQEVTVSLTDTGFSPAVILVQKGLGVQWRIINSPADGTNGVSILIPAYSTQIELSEGNNLLDFYPDSSFDFSTGDNTFYGYVKVAEDLSAVDMEAVRREAGDFVTLIWPRETFEGDLGASCH